ncbi:hypothetical protein C8F04DRAFT_1192786 [Mycena alexandri]|uniref:Uncharacterized protein n=1 Tax=Mycena alexandri TaxID=1745969 RepID=A0AAD6WSU0_9AGAR|nr:hypothetical protein C8F04DRAFT_1192786 [Mycena alexandri]
MVLKALSLSNFHPRRSCRASIWKILTITAFRPHVDAGWSYVGLPASTLVYPLSTLVYPGLRRRKFGYVGYAVNLKNWHQIGEAGNYHDQWVRLPPWSTRVGAPCVYMGPERSACQRSFKTRWEIWNRLCHEEILKVMKVPTAPGVEYVYNEDDYEKPAEGTKKQRAKPPRGAVKKQKVTGEQDKPQRKKKVETAATTARKATVKRVRAQQKSGGAKKAKK